MILILDNYDSFTYNLVQRLGELDPQLQIEVHRNDQITVDGIRERAPSHLIISPGPCSPTEAGISVDCVHHLMGEMPILGVCLGHQAIGQATGGQIVRASQLMHGKTDEIRHRGTGIFRGLPDPMVATRYHSLLIKPETLSDEFEVTAWTTAPDGSTEVMGIQHREHPVFGVQFHPESFLTGRGPTLLKTFVHNEY